MQAAFITRQHLNVGQAPVSKSHRLRTLQMGITRHYRILIGLRGFHQRALQLTVCRQQFSHGVFTPKLKIGSDLVVTATAGVQFFAQLADFIDKLPFHPAMDIFSIALQNLLRVCTHLFQQHAQSVFQLILFLLGQYANGDQRFRPGDRTDDILLSQAIVKAQRVIELFEPLIRCLSKTPAPKCHNKFP